MRSYNFAWWDSVTSCFHSDYDVVVLRISEKLFIKVRTSRLRQYEIANRSGIHSATLSKLLWEIRWVRPNDPRVVAVGRVLGLRREECFEEVNSSEEE